MTKVTPLTVPALVTLVTGTQMRLFHPVNSLSVSRNLWLILVSKIWLFLYLVKNTSKKFQNYKDSISVLYSLALAIVELLAILWFFQNKSCKTYLELMLPPGDRNWQLIYPDCNWPKPNLGVEQTHLRHFRE